MKLNTLCCITVVFAILGDIQGSPFELTDAYIANIKKGIDALQVLSKSYTYQQLDSEPAIENGTNLIHDPKEFDFIIIGSGATGSVLANRLSEVPEWKILLLEAGVSETDITEIPAMKPYLQTTPYDWSYTTTSQEKSCLGMEEHKCSLPSGKALGGNTAVDDMLFTRGNQKDYDSWADQKLEGWCWEDLLPYFKKIEDAHITDLDRKYHNLGGPVHLEYFQNPSELQSHILEAGHEIGLKTIDVNGKEQLGLGIPQATTKNGKRNSAAESYVRPATKRPNLEVRPHSQVIKILISPHTKEAYGVKYLHEGKLHVVKASKEVIVSAGAIESPKLLMLSGIGPKETLEPLGIETHSDLKVGKNLKNQISFLGLNLIANRTNEKHNEHYDGVVDYLKNGKGPLTNPGIEVIGFIKTEASKDKHEYPDIELLITKNLYNKGHEHVRSLRIGKEIYDSVWKPIEGADGLTIQVILLHPKSSGAVTLHDKDPLHHPLIDTHSLTDLDDHDVETLVSGIQKALKLAHTETLQKAGIELNPNKVIGCEHLDKEEYWKCAIKHLTTNTDKVTGTVKMGEKPEEGGCVDNHLRVHNIHKLRVADASVIPVTISGDITAINYVIGEKAADLLKHDWK